MDGKPEIHHIPLLVAAKQILAEVDTRLHVAVPCHGLFVDRKSADLI
jgi:hypothetical protein